MQLFSAKTTVHTGYDFQNDKKDNKHAMKVVQMMRMLFLYCC